MGVLLPRVNILFEQLKQQLSYIPVRVRKLCIYKKNIFQTVYTVQCTAQKLRSRCKQTKKSGFHKWGKAHLWRSQYFCYELLF